MHVPIYYNEIYSYDLRLMLCALYSMTALIGRDITRVIVSLHVNTHSKFLNNCWTCIHLYKEHET